MDRAGWGEEEGMHTTCLDLGGFGSLDKRSRGGGGGGVRPVLLLVRLREFTVQNIKLMFKFLQTMKKANVVSNINSNNIKDK